MSSSSQIFSAPEEGEKTDEVSTPETPPVIEKPKPKAPLKRQNLDDPLVRYKVVAIDTIEGKLRAEIMDRKMGIRLKVNVGDKVDNYKVVYIDDVEETVDFKSADATFFSLKLVP